MIIHRALYREASSSTIAVITVLLVLFMFLTLTKLMGKAAAGDYSSEAVWLLLGLQLLVKLDVLIPLSLYIGLIITLGRWYRDNEMTVLAACGIGVLSLLRPVLVLSAIFILVVAVLSFYLTPKAARGVERIKGESGKHQTISGITPGVFTESGKGKRIFYVEKISKSKNPLQTIFLRSIEPGKTSVLMAQSGYRRTDKKTGDNFIVLEKGRIYEEQLDRQRYGEIIFDSYELRIQPKKERFLSKKSSSLPSTVIMKGKTAAHRAEWHWRMAKPIMVLVLAVFALVMSFTDSRRGRFASVFMAILLYFIYSNLLGLGQSLIKQGRMLEWAGLWWVHIFMAALALYFLLLRNQNKPLLSLPEWRKR